MVLVWRAELDEIGTGEFGSETKGWTGFELGEDAGRHFIFNCFIVV